MSWAAANVNADERRARSHLSRENDKADVENKKCYEAAVRAHHRGTVEDLAYAAETYNALLLHPRLQTNADNDNRARVSGISPGNKRLRLLCLHNLGKLEEQTGKLTEALEHYAEAADLDGSRTQTWHRMGVVAVRLNKYRVARFAFEQGTNVVWLLG